MLLESTDSIPETQANIGGLAELFYNICFSTSKPGMSAIPEQCYAQNQELEGLAEEVLGNGLDFFRGLLEDPTIWQSDMIGSGDAENGLEQFISETVFTQDRVFEIL